jgi:hypothetical protein
VNQNPQPIYLFADSQLLFWRDGGNLFLDSVVRLTARDSPRAAYIGASNGDDPEYYSIFEAAMEGAGVRDCRTIPRAFTPQDQSLLNDADIILLAGGNVESGWDVFVKTGMREFILRRYDEGAVLMGISAGAVQLGLYGPVKGVTTVAGLLGTFGLVPFVIDAHDEGREWGRLRRAVGLLGGVAKGIGIPAGGGLIYYPGRRVEAVRRPLHQLSAEGGEVVEALLPPKQEG